MKRLRRYSLHAASAALLAVVFTLAAPRAVRAVTSALVQVTNTAAIPAITQGVNQLASQNVHLHGLISVDTTSALGREMTDGTFSGSPYVVPPGQSLIITSIECTPQASSSGVDELFIRNASSGNNREFPIVTHAYTTQLQFSTGIVFPAGESVSIYNSLSSAGQVYIDMHGYLTSN